MLFACELFFTSCLAEHHHLRLIPEKIEIYLGKRYLLLYHRGIDTCSCYVAHKDEALQQTVLEYQLLVDFLVCVFGNVLIAVIASGCYDMQTVEAYGIHRYSVQIKRFLACHIFTCDLALHKCVRQKCEYPVGI